MSGAFLKVGDKVERIKTLLLFFLFARFLNDRAKVAVRISHEFKDDGVVILENFVEFLVILVLGDVDRADQVDRHVANRVVGRLIFSLEGYDGRFKARKRAVAPNNTDRLNFVGIIKRICILV